MMTELPPSDRPLRLARAAELASIEIEVRASLDWRPHHETARSIARFVADGRELIDRARNGDHNSQFRCAVALWNLGRQKHIKLLDDTHREIIEAIG